MTMHPSTHRLSSIGRACTLAALLLTPGCDFLNNGTKNTPVKLPEILWSHPLSFFDIDSTVPHLDATHAYVAATRQLTRYELDTGTQSWQVDLDLDLGISGRKVLGDAERVYLNDRAWVRAFDKPTGQLLWDTPLVGFSAIHLAVMAQNATHLYLGGSDEVLRLRKHDGMIDLRIPIVELRPEGIDQSAHDPVVTDDGWLYVPTGYFVRENRATSGNLLAYDAETGAFRWGFEIPYHLIEVPEYNVIHRTGATAYGATVDGDYVAFSAGQSAFALDRFTGALHWEHFFEDQGFDAAMTVDNGIFYVGSMQASVTAFRLEDGEKLWERPLLGAGAGSLLTLLTLRDDHIVFTSGQLWMLDKHTGRLVWHAFPPDAREGAVYLSPAAVGRDHMVVVGSEQVYCLTRP